MTLTDVIQNAIDAIAIVFSTIFRYIAIVMASKLTGDGLQRMLSNFFLFSLDL